MRTPDTPPLPESLRPEGKIFANAGWMRFVGAGLELSGISLLFAAVGFGLDRWLGDDRLIATAIAVLVGFTLGMIRFVMMASGANTRSSKS